MADCTLPLSIVSGKFLGSQDRIVVAGNSHHLHHTTLPPYNAGHCHASAMLEIHYVVDDEMTNEKYFHNKSELPFMGSTVEALELVGLPRLGKSFLAVVLANDSPTSNTTSPSSAGVALIEIEADVNNAIMTPASLLQSTSCAIAPSFSSLAYCADQELLAAAGNHGEVVMWDLSTGKELKRFTADANGVSKLEFSRSGQLVTCGMSTQNQLYLWDIRMGRNTIPSSWSSSSSSSSSAAAAAAPTAHVSVSRTLRHPAAATANTDTYASFFSSSSNAQNSSSSNPFHYTSLSAQSVYNKIICGSSSGSVSVWDLRSEVLTECFPHAADANVTAVLAHPWKQDLLISAATDGTVRTTDLLQVGSVAGEIDGRGGASSSSSSSSYLGNNFPPSKAHSTVVSDWASFTALDTDSTSGMLAAMSAIGGLWRFQLN